MADESKDKPLNAEDVGEAFLQRALTILNWNHEFFELMRASPEAITDPPAHEAYRLQLRHLSE